MKFFMQIFVLIIIGLVQSFPVQLSAQSAPPTAADFAASPDRSFSISPNGKNIAFVNGANESALLYHLELDSNKMTPIPLGKAKFRSAYWGDDKHLLIRVSFFYKPDGIAEDSNYKYEISRTISYNVTNGKTALLVPNIDVNNNTSFPIQYIDSKKNRAIVNAVGNTGRALYVTDFDTGQGGKIASGDEDTRSYFLDKLGNPKIRYDTDISNKTSRYMKWDGKKWVEFLSWKDIFKVPYSIEGFVDENSVLVFERIDEKNVVRLLNLNDGKLSPYDFGAPAGKDISTTILDPYNFEPLGFRFDGYQNELQWIDPNLKKSQEILDASFPNKKVDIIDWDESKTRFLISVSAGNIAPLVYLFDTKIKSARILGGALPVFDNYVGPKKELLSFKASDGLEIPVFVTKPDKITNPMPAILLPHGGPQSQDDSDFDEISQFLASRGYVIIQPQFRGSQGKGEEYEDLGKGEWSGKMQSDTIEALDWAISQKWVDANKVCIFGMSYGGYSALVGATKTPQKFKCAASYGGVFDLAEVREDLVEDSVGGGDLAQSYWREHIGFAKYSVAKIAEISPVNSAKNATMPILLVHGVEDTTVPLKQSEAMAKALKNAGKDVTFIALEKEDHGLSTDVGKAKFLSILETFLAKHLK